MHHESEDDPSRKRTTSQVSSGHATVHQHERHFSTMLVQRRKW